MCGLAGFSFRNHKAIGEATRALLAFELGNQNDDRGGHSWGMMKAGRRGDAGDFFSIYRGLGKFSVEGTKVLGRYDTMMLHTRYATVGDKTIQNAHPFEIGDLIGAHNGGISNYREMCKKYDRKFDCDSPHIFAHLAENRSLEELIGYGAIEWTTKTSPRHIFLCRFKTGSLSVACLGEDKDRWGVVWSSSGTHLTKALEFSGLDEFAFPINIKDEEVYEIKDGEIYTTDKKLSLGSYVSSYYRGYGGYDDDTEYDFNRHSGHGKGTSPLVSDGRGGYKIPLPEKSTTGDLMLVNQGSTPKDLYRNYTPNMHYYYKWIGGDSNNTYVIHKASDDRKVVEAYGYKAAKETAEGLDAAYHKHFLAQKKAEEESQTEDFTIEVDMDDEGEREYTTNRQYYIMQNDTDAWMILKVGGYGPEKKDLLVSMTQDHTSAIALAQEYENRDGKVPDEATEEDLQVLQELFPDSSKDELEAHIRGR